MKSFSIVVKKKIKDFKKTITVDGCKSTSIRYFATAAQAYGTSTAKGIPSSDDVLATIRAFKKLGVKIIKKKKIYYCYGNGLGSLQTKNNLSINCSNSGTLARLLMGILSTYPHKIKIIGDHTLNKRDMKRVVEPLEKFGATFEPKNKKNLPLFITGSEMPMPINHVESIGSGQVKGLITYAALDTPGLTQIIEKKPSRNHQEILLKFVGAGVKVKKFKNYNLISIKGQKDFKAFDLSIPGDISSAAFFICLTLLSKNSTIKIQDVGLNSTRTGIITILKKMNAQIKITNIKTICGEKVGNIIVKSSNLKSTNCPASLIPFAIDEMPIIFLCAAKAKGVSSFVELGELEKKESRRLSLMNKILNQIGIRTLLKDDSIKIYGNPKLTLKNKPYKIKTMYDHRLCMCGVVLGLIFGGKVIVEDCHSITTSFPSFLKIINSLGAVTKYEIKKNH